MRRRTWRRPFIVRAWTIIRCRQVRCRHQKDWRAFPFKEIVPHNASLSHAGNDVPNARDYFSGHYQRYVINAQAVCDHEYRFMWLGVHGPGGCSYLVCYQRSSISAMVDELPTGAGILSAMHTQFRTHVDTESNWKPQNAGTGWKLMRHCRNATLLVATKSLQPPGPYTPSHRKRYAWSYTAEALITYASFDNDRRSSHVVH